MREGLRSFSIDCIQAATNLNKKTKDVPNKVLEDYLISGYGIFGGETKHWAKLRFEAKRARWVASENWHPQQKGHFDEEGRYLLEVPYAEDNELMMEILRHGSAVEVLSPQILRDKVQAEIQQAEKLYQ